MTDHEPEYRRRIRQEAKQDKRAAERERDKATKNADIEKIIDAVESLGEQLNRQPDENTPQRQRDRLWQHAEVIGLWLAAFVGIAAIYISSHDAHEQAKLMRGQLGEMQAAQRAWLFYRKIEPIRIQANSPIEYEMLERNFGLTPATQVKMRIDNGFVPIPVGGNMQRLAFSLVDMCKANLPWLNVVGEVFPTSGFPDSENGHAKGPVERFSSDSVRPGIYADAEFWAERKLFYVRGCAAYQTMGVIHETRFRRILIINPSS